MTAWRRTNLVSAEPGGGAGAVVARRLRRSQRTCDLLTGLADRDAFDRLSVASGPAWPRSVLLLDLDRFRAINDVHGCALGDRVLRAVAARMEAVCSGWPSVVLLARLAGDEFAVVLEGGERAACEALAEALRDAVREPIAVGGVQLLLDAGIGIALPHGELTIWELASRAGAALRPLKQTGKLPRTIVYEEAEHAQLLDRLALGLDLRTALAEDQVELDYQPIVDLGRRCVIGYEALVRWSHPERGRLGPLTFVPLAEEAGLIVELGEWVLTHACAEAVGWRGRGPAPAPFVTVNLSVRELDDPTFVARFRATLANSGLAPERLKVELTESVLAAGLDRVVPPLKALRQAGVGVLLDDFGTGYSSLQYIRELPLDGVKLDRVFASDLDVSAGAWTLTRAAVGMLGELGLEVIAEGVESAAQLAQLRSLGCRFGQGYYFARPLPGSRVSAGLPDCEPA